jgi:hypothetical protein
MLTALAQLDSRNWVDLLKAFDLNAQTSVPPADHRGSVGPAHELSPSAVAPSGMVEESLDSSALQWER